MTESEPQVSAKTPTQWATEDGIWRPITGSLSPRLLPNMYEMLVMQTQAGVQVFLREMDTLQTDKLLAIKGSLAEYIIGLMDHFWTNDALYDKMGLIHKRGVLLEGAPGSGKTATALLVAREVVKRGGVSIFISPNTDIAALGGLLKKIREIEPDVPIVTIMEDIDKHHKKSIDVLLPVLDGENQVSKVFHLATTNFIEKLDHRILNRPSRFDEVLKAEAPNEMARATYLKSILPKDLNPAITEELITTSAGLMFAHLKELAICTVVYGKPIQETVKRLIKLSERVGTGFMGANAEEAQVVFQSYKPVPSLMTLIAASEALLDEANAQSSGG